MSRPALVHRGEFVMPKDAVDRIGLGPLEALRRGRLPEYADGGYVLPRIGRTVPMAASQAASPVVNVPVSVVNRFDAQSFLSEALSQPGSAKLVLNLVRSQPGAFRAAIGG